MKRDLAIAVGALGVLAISWGTHPGGVLLGAALGLLLASVLVAVHHAEAIAHRIGEPFGTLVLAVCVTLIEVGLIVSLMAGGKPGTETLARDTVFAAAMICLNGIVGLSLVIGALKYRVVRFSADATAGLLGAFVALAALTLVLPTFTESTGEATYTSGQLTFASVSALVLYGVFVLVQTTFDRPTFAHEPGLGDAGSDYTRPGARASALTHLSSAPLWHHGGLLLGCLVAVVGLAKVCAGAIEDVVDSLGATPSLVGVILAAIVLLPELIAACRAASRNRLQASMNLGVGSAIASIGLTIPAVAAASIWLDVDLVLGLDAKEIVLLALSVVLATLTLSRGRATLLNGTIHVAVLAAFVFLTIQP